MPPSPPAASFSASTAGTYKVVGRGRGRNKSDTSTVVVVPPPTDLVGIEAAPDSVAVAAGANHTFTALGRLSDGTTTSVGVTWTATGGAIDAGGVYTAGNAGGKFRVVATKSSGTLADTADVTARLGPGRHDATGASADAGFGHPQAGFGVPGQQRHPASSRRTAVTVWATAWPSP